MGRIRYKCYSLQIEKKSLRSLKNKVTITNFCNSKHELRRWVQPITRWVLWLSTRANIKSLEFFTGDECRMIIFKEPMENKAMRGHLIRSAEVDNQGSCRVMCYMEPNCVSINFGPSEKGRYKCELNSATDEDQLSFLEDKDTYTFLAIEV